VVLAVAVVLGARALWAQTLDEQLAMRLSPAANTTIVLKPALTIDVFSRGSQRKGTVAFGGAVDWLPRVPLAVNLAGFRALDAGGATLRSSFEIGGAFRFRDQLVAETRDIFVSGRQTKDSVYTTYFVGRTVLRRYTTLRGGLSVSRIYESGTAPSLSSTSRAAYVGVALNQLANDPRGALGLKWVRTLAADLLIGSADSSAFSSGQGKLGFRGMWTTDFGTGSAISSRLEAGSHPGQGFYARATIDFNVMLLDVLKL
jgi:hypothetical protein